MIEENEGDSASTILPLHAGGARAPWYLTPPLSGSTLGYMELARTLGDQPVFGLQAPGLERGGEPLSRLPAIAEAYRKEIARQGIAHPLKLAGWSLGGLTALELAQQHVAAGGEVAQLLLIDTAPHYVFGMAPADLTDDIAFAAKVTHAETPPPGDRMARLAALMERAIEVGILHDGMSLAQFDAIVRVAAAAQRAYEDYRPTPYYGPVTLVKAADNPQWNTYDIEAIWAPICPNYEVMVVPGTHDTLFSSENIETTRRLFLKDDP
ncbi:thioesterase domain-containing protein [Rubricella aquisinus]|uniref:Thioesterase domain-containing protein n=1 Tax=Rubricella aquisinus TaxID=2028108 RepID=A0A840X3A5_9RHOB|nr:thioesterase domain-containing protein [Rubricella aquisinus]MBB5516325.1 thioesterase domain-containing protein [Rubricella aquisinus]